MTPFEIWWYHEGSGPPLPGEDAEEHCKRMCKIAWDKSQDAEREACVKAVETLEWSNWFQADCVAAIRARGQL